MNYLFNHFLLQMQKAGGFTSYETALLRYSIATFFSEISKFLMYFAFFSLLGRAPAFLWAFFSLILLRIFTGGLHMKTYFGCFLMSFLLFAGILFLGWAVPIDYHVGIGILILCMAAVYFFAPIPSEYRPVPSPEKQKCFRNIALGYLAFYMMLVLFLKNNPYTSIGIWTIILQTLQLAVVKLQRRYYNVKLFKKSAY